jgi:hypothetical protein
MVRKSDDLWAAGLFPPGIALTYELLLCNPIAASA